MSDTLEIGLALLPEQERHLATLNTGASRREIAHCLRIDIEGVLQVQRLQQALDSLLSQHGALGLRLAAVPGYHGLRQFLVAEAAQVDLQLTVPNADLPEVQQEAWLNAPWPRSGAVLQGLLLQTGEDRWQLLLAVVRLAADAGSLTVCFNTLAQAYEMAATTEVAEPGQFAQYLEWRSEVLFDEDAEAARQYWQAQVPGEQAALEPTLPYRQGWAMANGVTHCLNATLDNALRDRLVELALDLGVGLEALLQGAWWVLLARISGRDSFTAGWRHDGRDDYEFFADGIGLFEKTLPVGLSLDLGQSFAAWAVQLAKQLEQHATWQEYAANNLPAQLANPAYVFAARKALVTRQVAGARWQPVRLGEALPQFELQLQVCLDKGVELHLEGQAEHYSQAAVEVLLDQYLTLLQGIVEDSQQTLGRFTLSSAAAKQTLLAFNPEVAPLGPRVLLPERIAQWAEIMPDALAVVAEGIRLTYGELDQHVRQLAIALAGQGVRQGSLVALALPRSPQLVVAILASWRIGAGYLPLDPQWPHARQLQIVEQAVPSLLLTNAGHLSAFQGQGIEVMNIDALRVDEREDFVSSVLNGEDVAYVLFTSGSTGVPKGVVVEHRQLLNYSIGVCQQLDLEQCRHFALTSTVAADLGNTSLFAALYLGATLHIAAEDSVQSPEAFARFIRERQIDCVKIVPSHLAALLEAQTPCLPATLVLGGEAVAGALVQRIFQIKGDCRVFNHYGPTETTVGVLVHPVTAEDGQLASLPLTQVLPHNRVLVLDSDHRLVACGELGELYIGGEQLARGYLGALEQTAQVFVTVGDERFYRSGDLARYRPEGGVQLYGRGDQQAKVRGFRIELAEVEAQLARLPEVGEVAVTLVPLEGGELEPVAYVVPRVNAGENLSFTLTAALARCLPAVMLPRHILFLPQMPRLANGKIDRMALRQRVVSVQDTVEHVAPRDALEELLASRMAQLLGVERLSVEQDFFTIGGHSLLVIKLVARIRKLLRLDIPPAVVFDNPSPAGLALALRGISGADQGRLEAVARAYLQLEALPVEERARLEEKAKRLREKTD